MNDFNHSSGSLNTGSPRRRPVLGLLVLLVSLLAACSSRAEVTPTPSPTPTRAPMVASNQNVEALSAAEAALAELEFGFAPLLEEEATRIVVETGPDGEVARLAYPLQPADPVEWPAKDSFIVAYAVQRVLLDSPRVRDITLSRFDIAAPVESQPGLVDHYAALVRFVDGSQAVVDLTPLASNFGARHPSRELLTTPATLERQFDEWRRGVLLNILQPMKVVQTGNNMYYLLVETQVLPGHYEFSLRVHLTQPATPIQPLRLTRGSMASITIERADFEAVRQHLVEVGPQAFNDDPGLVLFAGANDPALRSVLDEHLYLLWHLATKLEHKPAPVMATPTPTPTPTPSPTPTSPALPLLTS